MMASKPTSLMRSSMGSIASVVFRSASSSTAWMGGQPPAGESPMPSLSSRSISISGGIAAAPRARIWSRSSGVSFSFVERSWSMGVTTRDYTRSSLAASVVSEGRCLAASAKSDSVCLHGDPP
jgi:hypothetical protein